jgi:hypothetical protein
VNSPSSPEQAGDCSVPSSSDGAQLPLLSVTPTASGSSASGAGMWSTPQVADVWAPGTHESRRERLKGRGGARMLCTDVASPSTPTSAPSTPSPDRATLSPAASPASRIRRPGNVWGDSTIETSGLTPFAYCEKVRLPSGSSRTYPVSSRAEMLTDSPCSGASSVTYPKRGSMRNGACWEQTTSVPRIDGSGCGFWPTATAQDAKNDAGPSQWERNSDPLNVAVKRPVARGTSTPQTWGTPRSSDYKGSGPVGSKSHAHMLDRDYLCAQVMVRQWATPEVACALGGHLSRGGDRKNEPLLGGQVKASQPGTTGSLNPTWVGPLMGWPMNWEDSETPHARELLRWLVSFRLSHMLYFTHGTTNHRTAEEVRAMRRPDDSPADAERDAGGHGIMEPEEVLLSLLCELKTALDEEADLSLACAEVDRQRVCGVRQEDQIAGAPHRWGPVPQPAGEHPDLVHHLSPLSPRYGVEAWLDGSWEAGIPRVATGVAHRVDRLRALGNGQVPQSMAAAFITLARQAGL